MIDRQPTKPGRRQFNLEGLEGINTPEQLLAYLKNPEGFHAVVKRADEPTEDGTTLNTETLLSAETSTLYGFSIIESTVNKVLQLIHRLLMPTGGIIMWSGTVAAIPTGWSLCDGTNNTPDLRGKFIVGAGGTYAVGNTGGANSVTLTVAEMPSHGHSIAVYYGSGNASASLVGSQGAGTGYTGSGTASTYSAGSNTSHENRPPYYALAYIMKL